MKKLVMALFGLLIASLLIPATYAASAGQAVTLVVEGEQVEPDVPPLIQNGRTLVPIRVISERLGAEVDWDQSSRTAVVNLGGNQLELRVNSKSALVNGKSVQLDTSPLVYHDRMLLPLRFVGEALGFTIGWEEQTRTVVANRRVAVHINGEEAPQTVKAYKLNGTLYVTIKGIAEKLGMSPEALDKPSAAKNIDGNWVVPAGLVGQLLKGKAEWDEEKNRLTVEKLSRFLGVQVKGDTVEIDMSEWTTPRHFALQGPHRVVIDFPASKLSAELLERMENGEELVVYGEESDGDGAADQPVKDGQRNDKAPLIKQVRYSQYSNSPYTVRVVVELSQKSRYELVETADGWKLNLSPLPRKTGFMIVVDAGHGGKDPGAKGVAGNWEKSYNLAVANRVIELLKQYPEFQPVATRTGDEYPTLQERVALANELEADLFISIHANSFSNSSTRGTETYYYTPQSKAFAEIVHRHLLQATKFPDRKVRAYPFYVIKNTKMPSVLTETGYLTNPIDNAEIMKPEFQERVAKALVAAVREYYEQYQ